MPMLEWAGKKKVVNHHNEVPFHTLARKWGFGVAGEVEKVGGGGGGGGQRCLASALVANGRAGAPRPPLDENMIIHGDNLLALKSLLPRYEGKVKCIYIDPPYNTGNEGWVYNDNVNDPQIKAWLNKVVGKEGEDFTRHDKWLCMMYPRLMLLRKLMSEDGAIFISIDDNELYSLKFVCDEIFGSACFVGDISWQRTYSTRNDSKGVVHEVEHIVTYSKQPNWQPKKLPRSAEMDKKYKNPDNDVASWRSDNAYAPNAATHQGMVYAIQHPFTGKMLYPTVRSCWRYEQSEMLRIMNGWCTYELRDLNDAEKRGEICGMSAAEVRQGVKGIVLSKSLEESKKHAEAVLKKGPWPRFFFSKNGLGGIARKTYLENVGGIPPTNLWEYKDVGHTDEAKKELMAIFEGKSPFDTPKPVRLLSRILQIAADKDSIILDSFAGSGTTAHAVLDANKADGGNRKFILVEMMDYAESVTAERVKRVIQGYGHTEARRHGGGSSSQDLRDSVAPCEATNATGGSFGYYELGPELMRDGVLNEEAGAEAIREYVWYTETRGAGECEVEKVGGGGQRKDSYLLGTAFGVAYYFCYEKGEVVTLNRALLKKIKTKAESYVIYADICTLSAAELEKYHITFKKIPRDITRF